MKKVILGVSMILSAVMGGLIALFAYTQFVPAAHQARLNGAVSSNEDIVRPVKFTVPENMDFTGASASVTPAVVHIKTFGTPGTSGSMSRFQELFRDFLEEYQERGNTPPEGKTLLSSGSGVIVSSEGYILTNNHVVDGASEIMVMLNDKQEYTAELVGTDPTTDLAVLKVSTDDKLTALRFGDSDALRVGEWVLAVGNPFDLTSTVTAGIISAKGRNINLLRSRERMAVESFIQTDAAVNPGNSGGALVNLEGELVGINTAIASKTGSYAGYSFAVPATLAKKVYEDLKEYGRVQRALLGVSIREVNDEIAERAGLEKVSGVLVAAVSENGAARDAGIEEGDIILSIDDKSINSVAELQERIARKRPGESVRVRFLRDGEEETAEVTLRNRIGLTSILEPKKEGLSLEGMGVELRDLTDKEILEYGDKGAVVSKVGPGKFRTANVPEGFIITHLDKEEVNSAENFMDKLQKKEGGVLIEGIRPNGRKAFYAIGVN